MTSQRHTLEFAPRAIRSLRKLDQPVVRRIRAAAEALREDPRPAGVKMLTGAHGLLRIRVGDYRVIYTVDDGPTATSSSWSWRSATAATYTAEQ